MNSRKNLGPTLSRLQQQLDVQGPRKYWQSLDEIAGEPSFQELVKQEFPVLADIWPSALSRRKFLALMGASLGLAGVSGCSVRPAPEGTIVPYVRQPEQVTPGIPLFFATAMVHGGEAVGLLVESHEGRPTKVEGNPNHPGSRGATSIFHQASVLTLYDPSRSQTVTHQDHVRGWDDAEAAIELALAEQRKSGGAGLRILTEPVFSPSLADQIQQLLNDFPQAKWHQYEPVNDGVAMAALEAAFGESVSPIYDFSKADVVLALDADFLSEGPGALVYASDFMDRRRVRTGENDAGQASMNRLYSVETAVSCTGAKADHRLAVRMSEIEGIARAIAAAIGVEGVSGTDGTHEKWCAAVARDLKQHRGKSIVLAGARQPKNVHLLAAAINETLGNVGQTIRYIVPPAAKPEDPLASLQDLARDIEQGKVQSLFILGGNPAYTAPADLRLSELLKNVTQTFHLSLFKDETSRLCQWHLPETHYLEAWSDGRAFDGTPSVGQPLIQPLYEGRSAREFIALLRGQRDADGRQLVRSFWKQEWQKTHLNGSDGDFEQFWRSALHDGVIGQAAEHKQVALRPDWQDQLTQQNGTGDTGENNLELVFQADPAIHDGRYAMNGWLQELPKPISKLTWGNAALMSPKTASKLGLSYESFAHGGEHGGFDVPLVDLQLDERAVTAPVWIMPGHADDSVTVYLGHGRRSAAKANGEWQETLGFNAYELRSSEAMWFAPGLKVSVRSEAYPLACTQARHLETKHGVIRSATLEEYRHDPRHAVEHKEEQEGGKLVQIEQPITLYKDFHYDPPQHKWGMSIDLTTCVGCNACVMACQAENNIPVVGKEQVLAGREMHWLRVDRYMSGSMDQPEEFHFQPLPCMHCEHAPCEYVCPTAATVHSAEGLNDMVYNRCVGTRFCSNNCPYKVRRFNFLEYADFKNETRRMQYNPDVTVRSRGVMEKCTYCVQRIRQAEINADAASRPIADGEVLTACQAVCPTKAIVFGDINDASSTVAKWKKSPLDYGLLAELNTYPRTTYLAAVRNPNPELEQG